MERILLIIFPCVLLAGCAELRRGTIENPYNNLSSEQLSKISGSELCRTITDSSYIRSKSVQQELINRGYKDCSESTVYCISNLNLTPGTDVYTNCKIQRDQYDLNVNQYNLNVQNSIRENNFQNQVIDKMNQPISPPPPSSPTIIQARPQNYPYTPPNTMNSNGINWGILK